MTRAMLGRVISLTVYRVVIASLSLIYQILALFIGFPIMPFLNVLVAVAVISLLTICYLLYLSPRRRERDLSGLIFVQFFFDILIISFLIAFATDADSHLRFAYLIIIVLSAIFLDRLTIYVIMVLTIGSYYIAIGFAPFFLEPENLAINAFEQEYFPALVGQTLLCLVTALLSGFIQTVYRAARRDLDLQEQRIRSLRQVHKNIVESLPSGLIICEPSGKISFVNRISQRILKQEADELVAGNAWALFSLEPPEPEQSEHLSRIEKRVDVKGVKRTLGISYRPMKTEGGDRGYMIIFQDLTKIRLLEAHKQLSDKMVAIGKVAAGVAHEIRNPLAAISGSIQVIKELIPDDPMAVELAEIVDRETKRLNEIISQFLAYARPSAPPTFGEVDLVSFMEEWLHLVENDPQMKDLKIEFRHSKETCMIMADANRLKQVFWNLIRNSYQACQHHPRVEICCQPERERVICSISDNGSGMSEEQLKDLFTPFLSFNQTGTGLGMSIVYDIMLMHHGSIDVQSTPGEGTQVTLTFERIEE